MKDLHLSKKERLSFLLQLKILQKLSEPGEFSYYQEKITALENGYSLHYGDMFDMVSESELSEEECQFVLNILDMYRGIIFSYLKLYKDNSIVFLKESQIKFPGFDGNNETQHMCYAKYFIYDLERYDEIRERAPIDLNSHYPTLGRYRKMLIKWQALPIQERYSMSEDTIISIISISEYCDV